MKLRGVIDHWRNRPAREQWLIGVPVVALLAAVLYLGAWEPLRGSVARLRAALPDAEARRELVRMQTAELRAQPAPAAGTVAAPSAPLVQAALERRQLKSAQPTLEPAGEGRARLAFARVPFHALWPLLQELQNDRGVRVVSMRMDRLDGGNVRFEAVLGTGER